MAVKWWIGAVLVVAAAAECPRVRAADPDTRPATRPGDGVDYVRRLARSLDQGPPASRTEAAQRLAEINNPESRAAITAALTSPDDRTQAAAAHAASEATSPDPAWVAPLSAILDRTQNPETAGQAALALAGFDQEPRAYEALIRAAQAHRTGQIQAINAMGRVVQKRVAATLLALSNGAAESAAVHEAAAGALARISPQTSRTDGGVAWTRWWNERSVMDDAAWRARVIVEQHRFLETSGARAAAQVADLRAVLYQTLYNQYEQKNALEKSDYLLRFLNSPQPEVRAVGAKIIPEAVQAAVQLKADVKERLEALLSDTSAEVRLNAAVAIYYTSYTNAFRTIVAQLKVENDLRVKRALVQTLSRMDAQAIPVLEGLLHDPSETIAGTAADTLAALVPALNLNPQDRQAIFDVIRQTLIERTGPPGQPKADASMDLRASLVGAMGVTADWANAVQTVQLFQEFLGTEPSVVRQAAVKSLGYAGFNAGRILGDELNPNNETDPAVRREAALALGSIRSFSFANRLEESSRAYYEPNPTVREAAWQSFQRVLPYADPSELLQWSQQFKTRNEPDRRLVVQRVACRKIKEPRVLAAELQTLGDISFNDLKRPDDAIQPYRDALRTFQQLSSLQLGLMKSLLNAYLASGKTKEAIDFCREQLQIDPRTRIQLGVTLAENVETWAKDPAKWARERDLIEQAITLDLDDHEKDRLREDLKRIPEPPATRPAQASR